MPTSHRVWLIGLIKVHFQHETRAIRDLDLRSAEDEVIFDRGREADVILITKSQGLCRNSGPEGLAAQSDLVALRQHFGGKTEGSLGGAS